MTFLHVETTPLAGRDTIFCDYTAQAFPQSWGLYDHWSRAVPCWTAGRWYRTWAWADANGSASATVSPGMQGQGW